jgi:hypothetical protein
LVAALFVAAAPGVAGAHSFCVATSTQLQDALTQSSDGGAYDGEDNFILLRAGVFTTGAVTANGPFRYHGSSSRHIDLYGGYAAGCSETSHDARDTILDGNHATQVLNVRSTSGPIDMAYFTLRNGESANAGAGLSINSTAGDDAQAAATNLIIRDNHSAVSAGGFFIASGAGQAIYFEDNLVVGNSADNGNGAGNLLPGGSMAVANNTITQNTTTLVGGTGGVRVAGAAGYSCGIAGNIIWNNANVGLFLANSNANVQYNVIGTIDGATPSNSAGNVDQAPQFVDAAAGNFHLKSNSPAIGLAVDTYGAYDVYGNASPPYRSISDVGALFATIFGSGFE